MSKKRILNITSRKKRDTMLTWSNTSATGTSIAPRQDAAYINGSTGGAFVWVPTARDLVIGADLAQVANESARTATTCYMRGLSEHLRIQTSTGLPWFHRRICFTYKGIDPFRRTFTGDTGTPQTYLESSNGYTRLLFNAQVNTTPNWNNQVQSIMFKGTQGVDWDDTITAPLDTRRITVKFDKNWCYRSGNANGIAKEVKLWHGMNKNLVYDDDEAGTTETTSYFSVDSKAGMGDYYVVDFFTAGTGGGTADLLRLSISSNLYWHEK